MVLSAFMFLNLFIGVVVTALDDVTPENKPKLTHIAHSDELVLEEIKALRQEMKALRTEMARTDAGPVT